MSEEMRVVAAGMDLDGTDFLLQDRTFVSKKLDVIMML